MKRAEKIEKVEQAIETFYHQKDLAPQLVESILYSVRAGGKRLRPLLFLELLEAFGRPLVEAHFQVAAALEMIHTGSLIHDDLPAMDNDDYRRGRLTNHRKFGEALAILAGDSLFLDPYGLLASIDLPDEVKLALIAELSAASGTFGMVAGQALDIEGEKHALKLSELQTIHAHKTGKLLTFPFVAVGLIVQPSIRVQANLRQVGELLGLAFQVRDDVLDVTASFEELGKTPKKDLLADKSTYPALLGLEEAKLFFEKTLTKAETILYQIESEATFNSQTIREIIESLRIYD